MTELKNGSEPKNKSRLLDLLIIMRQSGQPFFGIQTVLSPLIDREIKKREKSSADGLASNPANNNTRI